MAVRPLQLTSPILYWSYLRGNEGILIVKKSLNEKRKDSAFFNIHMTISGLKSSFCLSVCRSDSLRLIITFVAVIPRGQLPIRLNRCLTGIKLFDLFFKKTFF